MQYRPPLTADALRKIWFADSSGHTRTLLWEIRRLHDRVAQLEQLQRDLDAFAIAFAARGQPFPDIQLQLYWNRVRECLEVEKRLSERGFFR